MKAKMEDGESRMEWRMEGRGWRMAVGGLFGVPTSAGPVPPEGGTPNGDPPCSILHPRSHIPPKGGTPNGHPPSSILHPRSPIAPEGGTPNGSEMRPCLRRFQSQGIATPVSNHYNIHQFSMLYDFIAARMAFSGCFDHS